MLNRGPNTDRRLRADQVVVQAVSLPVTAAEALTSAICRSGLEHWRHLRGDRAMPNRNAVDPSAMRPLLPYTFLLDALERGTDFRYRLVGTDIVAHTPRDNTGRRLSEIADQGTQQQLTALYASVVAGRTPRFQRIAYRTRMGLRSWYETVVCPLGDPSGAGDVAMLIGWAEHFHQPVAETGSA
ncbi:hypothetical protein GCM10017083_32310 [Thalassobaculum fulvum]|uniref:PAS domain-containing protein n=1 Tax=Thalassobaculum fulvum TaxID=1633335 RepID=A0A918XTV0_9PROT|nr:PAS domain-containing protein [Thalassobaculum fulvum]GHD54600.1 hypothetical protein GCM10017083_32310 [Thalassobaculum fulvum]